MNTKATEIENKIPNASIFISTPGFNRLAKLSYDARMKQAEAILANKTEVKKCTFFRRQTMRKCR